MFNIFVGKYIPQRWLRVLLDSVILLVFVVIGNIIANKIFERKENRLNAIRNAREEMNERKRQILADSYSAKRLEKQKLKNQNIEESVVEDKTEELKEEQVEKKQVSKSTSSKKSYCHFFRHHSNYQ